MFDGNPFKLHLGAAGSAAGRERLLTAGWGVRIQPVPWLDLGASFPYKAARTRDPDSGRPIGVAGFGDVSLTAAWDILELANPSLLLRRCPDSGNRIWTPTDHFRFLKNPHLTLSGGLSAPTGPADIMDEDACDALDSRVQPGAGVWIPSLGLGYGQGFGSLIPGVGVRGAFPVGRDATRLRRSPSWSFSAGVTLRPKGNTESWAADLSIACDWVPGYSERGGAPVRGSRGSAVALSLGGSVGLGGGIVLAAQLSWEISDTRGHPENPWEPGLGGGLHLVVPCR